MRKFKLIKAYPQCPTIESIVSTDDSDNMWWFIKDPMKNKSESILRSEVLNFPEYWEEIIEKQYEILKMYGGLAGAEPHEEHFNCKHFACDIHSVKRLSDGEVFTVGDKLQYSTFVHTIESFKIIDNILYYTTNSGKDMWSNFKTWTKSKQPLFITEDLVEIYIGDTIYGACLTGIQPDEQIRKLTIRPLHIGGLPTNRKWFSTKEAAEEYILMNKPFLSVTDLERVCNPGTYSLTRLLEIAKEKLKI